MRKLAKGLIVFLFVLTAAIPKEVHGYAKSAPGTDSANPPRLVVFEAFMHDT